MLPALRTDRLSLADVMPGCLDAVTGAGGPFATPGIRKAVVVLIDGLGATALKARSGHARTLSAGLDRASTIDSGFPTTTAAALPTLTTGRSSGSHGMTGYTVRDPGGDRIVNLLGDWDGLDPQSWQRQKTVFERAAEAEVSAWAIGPERFRGTAFTRAVLRGAEYRGAELIADRFEATRAVLDASDRAIVYLYFPELDKAGHDAGWESAGWTTALERLDAELRAFLPRMRADEGLLVTADHGMVDVAHGSHVLLGGEGDVLVDGVRHIAGEPRCLQLFVDPRHDPAEVAHRWNAAEGHRSWVLTRAEAVAAGWFGSVEPPVLDRIGDVLVAARRPIAYYDTRSETSMRGRRMVGQHGSMTPEEVRVPLLRFGRFAA